MPQAFNQPHWNRCDTCGMGIKAGYRDNKQHHTLCGWCVRSVGGPTSYQYCLLSRLTQAECWSCIRPSRRPCPHGVHAAYMDELTASTIELTREHQLAEVRASLDSFPDPFADPPDPPPPPRPTERELARLRSYGPYDWRAQAFLARPKRR